MRIPPGPKNPVPSPGDRARSKLHRRPELRVVAVDPNPEDPSELATVITYLEIATGNEQTTTYRRWRHPCWYELI